MKRRKNETEKNLSGLNGWLDPHEGSWVQFVEVEKSSGLTVADWSQLIPSLTKESTVTAALTFYLCSVERFYLLCKYPLRTPAA